MNEIPLKKVLQFIKENGLFTPGETVVVAVSGGADSVALLDMLVSLGELSLNLVVAHLNHQLRGGESDGDEEFVRQLAKGYGLPFENRREDIHESARRERRSLEDAGRAARYGFFNEVAASRKAGVIALAHHCDDQAETVLMRLLRGAGGTGLCAMAPMSAGRYVRPLLCLNRSEIEGYLRTRGIPWRADSSNASLDFLRNRIRHELIPLLSCYNPAISQRLAATAEALAADEEVLNALTSAAFSRHAGTDADVVKLSIAGVMSELRGIRFRLYREAILRFRGDLNRISSDHLKAIDGMVFSERPNQAIDLPDGLNVSRCYGEISFSTTGGDSPLPAEEVIIDGPGIYPCPGNRVISVDYGTPPDDLASMAATVEYFDPDEAPFPWIIRNFRSGDRISPFGMNGSRKVKEMFIDAKIPPPERSRIPLLFRGDTLLWVAGIRRSSAAVIKSKKGSAVRIELLSNP